MIDLNGVKKSFGKNEVLRGLTFEVREHETLSLVGASGCGKTTTLNILAGLCQPDSGSVTINGVLVDQKNGKRLVHVDPSKRKVGYVFQDYALFPHMTASENISYGLKATHHPPDEVNQQTKDLLALVGLLDHSERYPHQLSGGQKQRIALARALATHPDVLLLDEPLAALDSSTRKALRIELRKILTTIEATAIYVTHELADAYAISNRIAILGDGIIQQVGDRDQIFTRTNSVHVAHFIGDNVLSGRIVNHSTDASTVQVNGTKISTDPIAHDGTGKVFLTIKPEEITISRGKNSEGNDHSYNNLHGLIIEIVRTRSLAEVIVDVGFPVKSALAINSLNELCLKEGQEVTVRFRNADVGIIEST